MIYLILSRFTVALFFRWPTLPISTKAAYETKENSISIPAAILKPPFFDIQRPFSLNYGAIGAVIGHELTRGFDNDGRRFDKNGKQANWWTNSTLKKFEANSKCFVDQYGKIFDRTARLKVRNLDLDWKSQVTNCRSMESEH